MHFFWLNRCSGFRLICFILFVPLKWILCTNTTPAKSIVSAAWYWWNKNTISFDSFDFRNENKMWFWNLYKYFLPSEHGPLKTNRGSSTSNCLNPFQTLPLPKSRYNLIFLWFSIDILLFPGEYSGTIENAIPRIQIYSQIIHADFILVSSLNVEFYEFVILFPCIDAQNLNFNSTASNLCGPN